MSIRTLSCALCAPVLVLLLSTIGRAQTFVDWTSGTTGTLGPVNVTLTSATNPHIVNPDMSGADYSALPASATQESIGYGVNSDWTVTFSQPVSNLLLYVAAWRGNLAQVDPVTYAFDQTPTIISGMGNGSITGNTLNLSGANLSGNFYRGILQFSGTFSSLSVASNAPASNFSLQDMTFAVPEPATLGLALSITAATLGRRRPRRQSAK